MSSPKSRSRLKVTYEKLEDVLGLRRGSIRNITLDYMHETISIIHDDKCQSKYYQIIEGGTPPKRKE